MDEVLAELIGIILGDGMIGIYKRKGRPGNQYRLKISMNAEKDREYSEYVAEIIEDIFSVKPIINFRKNEKTLDVIVTNPRVITTLLDIGMKKSPKWGAAIIPKRFLRNDLALKVLRGYVDTDGCIVVFNNNGTIYPRIEMKVCPSPMQRQFISILEKNGFRPRVNDIGKGKCRIMLSGKKKLMLWNRIIGFSNSRNKKMLGGYLKKIAGSGFEPLVSGL